jgi:CheY-like chemotaxis protein
MKWHNAARDFLPNTSRSVLISYKGVYHIAFYNKEQKNFSFPDGTVTQVIEPVNDVYWADIDHIPRAKTKKVLLVEDDADDQNLICAELKKVMPDVQVQVMADGQEALNYLLKRGQYKGTRELPDLILLDLNLPSVDGFQILLELNKHEHLRDIIVFVVSTSRNNDQWDKALNLGARCFYNKGSSSGELTKIVKEICANLN